MKTLEEIKDDYFQENYFLGSKLDESDWIEIHKRHQKETHFYLTEVLKELEKKNEILSMALNDLYFKTGCLRYFFRDKLSVRQLKEIDESLDEAYEALENNRPK